MRRSIASFSTSLVAFAAAANAAPPIAFAKVGSGNAAEVWLINADGSGAKRVYQGPSKVSISDLDVRPGGGQLAFVEGTKVLKVVTYDGAGVQQRVDILPQPSNCWDSGLDFRADGLLIFGASCGGGTTREIDEWDGSSVRTVVGSLDGIANKVRWLRDGSGFIWQTATASGLEFRKSDLGNPSSWNVIWRIPYPTNSVSYLDLARQSDAMLVSLGSSAQVQRVPFDFAGVGSPTTVAAGVDGHYNPDDSQLLYRVQTRKGWELTLKTGTATKVITTGAGVTDWGG